MRGTLPAALATTVTLAVTLAACGDALVERG